MSIDPPTLTTSRPLGGSVSFSSAGVVQLLSPDAMAPDAVVYELEPATVTVSGGRIVAQGADFAWTWLTEELETVTHAAHGGWSIFVVPGIADFGVLISPERVAEFRQVVSAFPGVRVRTQRAKEQPDFHRGQTPSTASLVAVPQSPSHDVDGNRETAVTDAITEPVMQIAIVEAAPNPFASLPEMHAPHHVDDPTVSTPSVSVAHAGVRDHLYSNRSDESARTEPATLTGIDARSISAWFGTHQVLDRVSLNMPAGEVTALIGPSGCGKSTFLRILNRMHEMIPSASLAGEVLVDGHDIYDVNRKLTDARREVGMVFQKPNPFPAMSIYDNVLASYRLTGTKVTAAARDEIVEACLTKAGLWLEVRDRLRQPGGGLSGGQQQRLCIARALAIRPRVLLMDEPCSALDPTSTRRIEETVIELAAELTIVIVTHNMQQAARVSSRCAFFLAEQGRPGVIVEHGPTPAMFGSPQDQRTHDYVNGRFG